MAISTYEVCLLCDGHSPSEDAFDCVSIYGLAFAPHGILRGAVCNAVDITQCAGSVLVHEGDGVSREEVLLGAGQLEPMGDVLGDVMGAGVIEREAMVNARKERAVASQPQLAFEFWKSDEYERQQRAAVPLIVQ
jgi:hypothetical protein